MAQVLLVHPSSKLRGIDYKTYLKETHSPSLGLACIGGYLERNGISVKIIDARVENIDERGLCEIIKKEKPAIVGCTSFTEEILDAKRVFEVAKKSNETVFTMLGGPHGTAIPLQTLNEIPALDAVVIGEGEKTSLELVKAVLSGKISRAKGLAIRKNGRPVLTAPRKAVKNLDELGFPAWHLFDISGYGKLFMISCYRGCPYRCYFCFGRYLGNACRFRSNDSLIEEMRIDIEKFGAKVIQFTDSTFTLGKARVMDLCQKIIDSDLNRKVTWLCETRADAVDEELLDKMKEAGCISISYGVESGNERLLYGIINKRETKEQIEKAVRMTKKAGIETRCFFIIGHAYETAESIKDTIKFSHKLSPTVASFGLMVPYPGSAIRKLAESGKGNIKWISGNWDDYKQMTYNAMELENLSISQLKKWRSKAYWSFYSRRPRKALSFAFGEQGYRLSQLPKIVFQNIRALAC